MPIEDITNENYQTFLELYGKPDKIILAGTNPKRPVDGKNCKALALVHGKPMVWYVIEANHESNYFNELIVTGPKDALENALTDLLTENNINNVKFIQEGPPGDASRMVPNLIKGINYSKSDSPFIGVSGCDVVDATGKNRQIIYNDISAKVIDDLKNDNLANVYWTMADQNEDNANFIGLKGKRYGLLFDKKMSLRLGNDHLMLKNKVIENEDLAIDLVKRRKIVWQVFKNTKNFGSFLYNQVGLEGIKYAAKGVYNQRKKSGFFPERLALALFPYFDIQISEFERIGREKVGLNVRLVPTIGGADIDTTDEYKHFKFAN